MRTFFAFLITIALALQALGAEAQEPPSPTDNSGSRADAQGGDEAPDPVALRLARALERRLTVWRSPRGRVVHVSHCRSVRGGCRSRVAAFARWMVDLSREHEIDPFVLAAMAVRESGLDPFARGSAGEMGIVQLHPQGVGRGVRFVRSEAYRRRCSRSPGACQREILEVGARHLSAAVERCGGIEAGLGAYNTGVCGPNAYSRRVMRERTRLLELAKNGDDRPTHVD